MSLHIFEGVKEKTHPPGICDRVSVALFISVLFRALISSAEVQYGPQLWERAVGLNRTEPKQSPVDSRCWIRDLPIPGQHSCMSEPLGPCMHCVHPHHLELFVLLHCVQTEECLKLFKHSSTTPSSFD
ncbi:hypothetical protein PBY51_023744 [Eleginops maclovinus]|uniref:Uncharacterized protein n=1 Tax=Eleginops maclovinus TaxID=56733 RepID=A0AAN7X0G0_ELEMC|nr:hypothetical protein PBY51_023744 [Eleginops maclovinus]